MVLSPWKCKNLQYVTFCCRFFESSFKKWTLQPKSLPRNSTVSRGTKPSKLYFAFNISNEFFIDIFESDLSREDSKKIIFDKINSIIDISKHQNIKETTILLEILMSTLFFEDLLLTFFKEESLDETI